MNEQVLLRELEFLHGFGFGAFFPKYPPIKKAHTTKRNKDMPRKVAHKQKNHVKRFNERMR